MKKRFFKLGIRTSLPAAMGGNTLADPVKLSAVQGAPGALPRRPLQARWLKGPDECILKVQIGYRVTTFLVPLGDQAIGYEPLNGFAAVVNPSAAASVLKI